MSIKKDIVWRVGVVYIVVLLFAFVIIGRVIFLQFFESEKWKSKSNKITLKDITIEPNRGDIYACDGRLLATSVPYYEIRMDLNSSALTDEVFKKGIDSLSLCLSKLFKDKSAEKYKRELTYERVKGNRYYLIKKKVSYTQLKQLRKFPIFRLGQYKGGLIINQDNKRIMPHHNLAARTIGYASQDVNVGIEGAYNNYLRGVIGIKLMQKLSGGIWMPVNDRNAVEPKDGKDILSTIDVNLQDVAENALLKQLNKMQASHGTAVLMEVKTGEVKAISNLQRNSDGSYSENFNYAIGESTEPGSTFKLASFIAAFEDKYIDLYDTINTDRGVIKFYDIEMSDSRKGGYGSITVKQAFEYSSNVAVTKVISKYYKNNEKQFIDRVYSMNLNEPLGLDIFGEGKPYIKYPTDKSWSGITLPWMSIGYEVQLTPLQILTFYNAVANNGKMVKPKFVKGVMEHGKLIKTFKTEVINPSICSKQTLVKAKIMLEGVVENGTAINLKNSNYKIAGKTGTAQIANKKYGYNHDKGISYQASFVGYFPADNPRYSCIVVVNSPSKSVYYGNLVAGPVFKEIADKVIAQEVELQEAKRADKKGVEKQFPYTKNSYKKDLEKVLKELKIPFNDEEINSEWVITSTKETTVEMQNRFIKNGLVPNIRGMGAKDAIYILENIGLKVEISGKGFVKSQSIKPGSRINKGQTIRIELG